MTRPALAVLLLLAASASAQPVRPDNPPRPVLSVPADGEGRAVPNPVSTQPEARSRPAAGLSPANTLLVSMSATAGGVGLGALVANGDGNAAAILAGVAAVLGPSVGNLALGERRDALVGAGLRAGGAGLALAGLHASVSDPDPGLGRDALAALTVVGAVAFVGGLGYDLVTSARNAGRVTVAPGVDGETRRPVGVLRVGL